MRTVDAHAHIQIHSCARGFVAAARVCTDGNEKNKRNETSGNCRALLQTDAFRSHAHMFARWLLALSSTT